MAPAVQACCATSSAVKMPPHALMGTAPPVAAATSATIRGVRPERGPPERPPRPVASPGVRHRERVRAHQAPAPPRRPRVRARSSTVARSSSVRNGGSFRSTGRFVRAAERRKQRPHVRPGRDARARSGCSRSARTRRRAVPGARPSLPHRRAPRRRRSPIAAPSVEHEPGWRAAASAPGLGSPIAFTIALVRGDRTILGLGFPSLGARVTVPPTTKPNPSRPSASRCRHALSKPAARPIGFGSADPAEVDLEGRVADDAADPLPRQRQGKQRRGEAVRGFGRKGEERGPPDGSVPAVHAAVATTHARMLSAL